MTTRVPLDILAQMIALSVVFGQVIDTTQVNNARPAFAEASVKTIEPSINDHTGRQLTTTNFVDRTDLLQFIVSAYLGADGAGACATKIALGYECAPIVGPVPAWMRTDRFEVIAKLPSDSLPIQTFDRLREFRFESSPRRNVYPLPVQLMLQRLLEDIFELKVRRERREIPVWAITGGKKELTQASSVAAPPADMHTHGLVFATRRSAPCPCPPDDPVQLVFQGSSLTDAADFFSTYLDRPVLDRTGVDGEYDFTIEFKGNSGAPWLRRGLPLMAGFDVPRLVEAFEALGFAVESAVAPFEVLVIEHAQRPSSN
jgi:uncharacterized protein (TIGR03435 family)